MNAKIKYGILVVVGAICFKYGQHVGLEKQWPLYEGLRITSAIIFGLMGAWLAIVYPEILKKVYKGITKEEKESLEFKRLLIPIRYSAAVLFAILFVGLAIPILKQFSYLNSHKPLFLGISYTFLWILTYLQMLALLLSTLPGEVKNRELKDIERKSKAVRRFTSLSNSSNN